MTLAEYSGDLCAKQKSFYKLIFSDLKKLGDSQI
jgi:hypothetical protein